MVAFSQEPRMDMVKSKIILYIICDDKSQIIHLIVKNVTENTTQILQERSPLEKISP